MSDASRAAWLRRALARGVVLLCALLVPALMVASVWREGKGGYYALGGLVPWSDGSNHYQGAVEVKDRAKLDYWNQRRPLNAAINSVKLRLGRDLKGWISVSAFLVAIALALAVREAWLLFGVPAAAVVVAIVGRHGAEYLATPMSENNGLFFGLLATATLLAAIRLRSALWFLCGMFLLSVAMELRPGALFVLPLLCLWGGIVFGDRLGKRLGIAALAILMTILGVLPARLYGALWGDGRSGAHSNFSLTIYGLAAGNRGWYQSHIDYPPERYPDEREHARILYERSIELIRAHPWQFAKALLQNLWFFLVNLDHFLKQGLVLTALGLVVCLRRWRDPASSFLLAVFLGVALSAPWLVRDATGRVFAVTVPLMALIPAAVLTFLQSLLAKPSDDRSRSTLAPITAMVLVAIVLTVPLVAAGRNDLAPLPPAPGPPATVFVPGESGEWINVVSDRELDRSHVPFVRESDLAADLALTELRKDRLERRRPPYSFGLSVDVRGLERRRRTTTWFVTPTGVHLPRVRRPLLLTGDERPAENGIYYLSVKKVYVLSADGRVWVPLLR